MLADALQALHDWEAAATIRRSLYIYPFLNAAHIFAMTLLIGGILPADLRLIGFFPSVALAPFLRLMTGIAALGLALAIVTGFLLFSVQPHEYAGNAAFLTKIALVAFGALLALAVRFSRAWRRALASSDVREGLRAAAFLSMLVWIAALLAGRWIAFV
jgi:hypothetical protein